MHGEEATFFNRNRRILKVLGKKYQLPKAGTTLLLLVDEPTVTLRTLELPMQPCGDGDGNIPEPSEWSDVLQKHQFVRGFMSGEGGGTP